MVATGMIGGRPDMRLFSFFNSIPARMTIYRVMYHLFVLITLHKVGKIPYHIIHCCMIHTLRYSM